jgi:hypothetical protein
MRSAPHASRRYWPLSVNAIKHPDMIAALRQAFAATEPDPLYAAASELSDDDRAVLLAVAERLARGRRDGAT